MGFLGVGIEERFLPPIQISVVDVKNWQKREPYNDLEENQVQVSSMIVLSHHIDVDEERKEEVIADLKRINPVAKILTMEEITIDMIPSLLPSENEYKKLDHQKAHWASCSTDIPDLPDLMCIQDICNAIPSNILRVKAVTKVGGEPGLTHFERTPDGEVFVKPYYGTPTTGPKLLTVGPGSDPNLLKDIIETSLKSAELRQQAESAS